jgi:hypothetical protein
MKNHCSHCGVECVFVLPLDERSRMPTLSGHVLAPEGHRPGTPRKTGEEGMQSHQPGLKTLLSLFRLAHNQSLLGELENGDQSA